MSDAALPPTSDPILPKPGMSSGAKVALGCGVLLLGGLGTCGIAGLWGAKAMVSGVAAMGKSEWTHMVVIEQELTSDDGVRKLYADNPLLGQAYPSEDDLLNAARPWRPMLTPLPLERPDLMSGQLSYQANRIDGESTVIMTYRNTLNGQLRCFFKGGKLADVSFKSGLDLKRDGLPTGGDPE